MNFPILKLPRELRDLVYDAVLSGIKADFLLAKEPEDGELGFTRPPLECLPADKLAEFGYESWEEYLQDEQQSDSSILYYRLSAPTTLVRTCKQISQELGKRFVVVDELVASSIHLDRFVADPSPMFLDICERSNFALRTAMIGQSTRFLHTLPDDIRIRVTSLVIGTKTWLSENLSNKGLLAPVFEQLPNLNELGVLVDSYTSGARNTNPGSFMYEQIAFYSHLFTDVTTLRLMYRRMPKATRRCPYRASNRYLEYEAMVETMSGRPPMNAWMTLDKIYRQFQRGMTEIATDEQRKQFRENKVSHVFEEWPTLEGRRKWSWVGATSVVTFSRPDVESRIDCSGLLEEYRIKFPILQGDRGDENKQ